MHMNIKYGDDNYLVRYLQAFLQEYYNKSLRVSGIYDEYTHTNLIEYLKLPNVQTSNYVISSLRNTYPDLFLYFINYPDIDGIVLISKSTSDETFEYMNSIRYSIVSDVYELGWSVSEFISYKLNDNDKFRIKLAPNKRENRFPNRELICMVNLFMNKYLYDYRISGSGSNGVLSPSINYPQFSISNNYYIGDIVVHNEELYEFKRNHNAGTEWNDREVNHIGYPDSYKIAVVEDCEPDTYYTICHAYDGIVNLVIASSQYSYNSDLSVNRSVENIESIYLDSGSLYCYKTSSNCNSIVIQVQYCKATANKYTVVVPIKVGDINLDGRVTEDDLDLLRKYLSLSQTSSRFELSPQQKYAACIDLINNPAPETGILDRDPNSFDVDRLRKFLDGELGTAVTLGLINYTYEVKSSDTKENTLMVTKGYFTKDDKSGNLAEVYFPSISFLNSQWMVNDKLLNYILDMAINPYSDEEDILYLQDLLSELYPDIKYEHRGIYDDHMKEIIKSYQIKKGIPYHTGYLDVQTEALIVSDINNIGNTDSKTYESIYFSTDSINYFNTDGQGSEETLLIVGRVIKNE